jgi:hypothetical protein
MEGGFGALGMQALVPALDGSYSQLQSLCKSGSTEEFRSLRNPPLAQYTEGSAILAMQDTHLSVDKAGRGRRRLRSLMHLKLSTRVQVKDNEIKAAREIVTRGH